MRTNPLTRKRYASEATVTVGGLSRIMQGIFGLGNPQVGLVNETPSLDAEKVGGIYQYFEGDVFLPGSANWVLEPSHETPLYPVWGAAFLRNPNSFNPIQQPQVYTSAASALFGVNGQVAGQMINQPLSEPAK